MASVALEVLGIRFRCDDRILVLGMMKLCLLEHIDSACSVCVHAG